MLPLQNVKYFWTDDNVVSFSLIICRWEYYCPHSDKELSQGFISLLGLWDKVISTAVPTSKFSCGFQMYWLLRELSGNTETQEKSEWYWQEVRIWWTSHKDEGTTMATGQGYGGINWGLLSFWSLCFDCRGKKWTTLKLKRICNIPKICRVRGKYVIYLSFTKIVAPNMNRLGLEKAA